jgi:hypothetical protein
MARSEPAEPKSGYSVASRYLDRLEGDDERRERDAEAE